MIEPCVHEPRSRQQADGFRGYKNIKTYIFVCTNCTILFSHHSNGPYNQNFSPRTFLQRPAKIQNELVKLETALNHLWDATFG